MNDEINSEKSRLRALLMRSHHMSPEEADFALERSRLSIHVPKGALASPAGQAALVTSILLGARCFGTVLVSGDYDHQIVAAQFPIGPSIREVMAAVGASSEAAPTARTISIGPAELVSNLPCIELSWNGWLACASPQGTKHLVGHGTNPLVGIAAAAMGLGTAFMQEMRDPNAGRRPQVVSLWEPGAPEAAGPDEYALPHALWMIGLGNLGQAYLWCLSWMHYADPHSVHIVLQDFDRINKENWGTSILVQRGRYGMLKTRASEDWLLHKGFSVTRIDRRLDEHTCRAPHDPGIALVGLDKIEPRRLLGRPGFRHVIDAGLGSTLRNFRDFRINVFDSGDDPAKHFKGVRDQSREELESVLNLPAYKKLLGKSTLESNCGVLTLAGQPIVLPFISALTATFAIAQAIRIESGFESYKALVGQIDDMRNLRAVKR